MCDPLLPQSPLPELHFRTYRGEADIPSIATLLETSFSANGEPMGIDPEALLAETRNPGNVDPCKDMILGFMDGRLIARSMLTWAEAMDQSSRHYQSWGDVHPEWRRRGIGTAMWQRNIDRLTTIAAGHDTDRPRFLSVPWLRGGDVGGAVLAERLGYERVRVYHHMTRPDLDDILVPPLPDGLEVRPVTSEDLRSVWDAMAEAFRDHFGAEDMSDQAFRGWLEQPQTDPSLLVIAFDGEEVAGGVHGEVHPYDNEANGYLRGWTDPIYVRRPWRRRGLAGALIGRALLLLRERGMTSAQLDVDTENANQALGLYERHGFASDREATEWLKPLP